MLLKTGAPDSSARSFYQSRDAGSVEWLGARSLLLSSWLRRGVVWWFLNVMAGFVVEEARHGEGQRQVEVGGETDCGADGGDSEVMKQ